MGIYAVFSGHSQLKNGLYTGANGYLNETIENENVAKAVHKYLKLGGATSDLFIIPRKHLSSKELEDDYKLPKANAKKYDAVIEIHFNSYKTTTTSMGTEVLYCTGSSRGRELAQRVNDKLDDIFKDRNTKSRNDLYMLTRTKHPSIIVEVCFLDSKSDVDLYKKHGPDKVGKLIAEGILNKEIKEVQQDEELFYRVVCGSYTKIENAERVVNDLKAKGYSAFIDVFRK